jgi:hypothetical protein
MSADDSKPTGGERSRRPEQSDGYSDSFQEGIAEAGFFVQQGLYAEAIAALEELRKNHGEDPRILGRLHTARTKLRQSSETAAAPKPAPVPPKLTPPPAQPQPKPKLTPMPVVQPIPPAAPVAPPEPELAPPPSAEPLPALSERLEGSSLSPFEPKRTELAPDRSPRSPGRGKILAALGGVLVLIAVVVVVLIVILRRAPKDTSDKAGGAQTVSSGGDSAPRPVGRRTPPPRRLAVADVSGSMSAMARTTGEDDGGLGVATGTTPDAATGDNIIDAKRKVRLRLTIAPKSADAVISFRGGKYITNRFVSKNLSLKSWTSAAATVSAQGGSVGGTDRGRGLHVAYVAVAAGLTLVAGSAAIGTAVKYQQQKPDGESYKTAAYVLAGVTAVTAVSAVVLAIFTDWSIFQQEPTGAKTTILPFTGPGSAGIVVTGRF